MPYKINSEKEKEIVNKVMASYESSKYDKFRRFKEEVWFKCLKSYKGILENTIQGKSNLFIPITFQQVETMTSRELSAIYDQDTLFSFIARKPQDEEDADILSKYAKFDINRIPNIYHKLNVFLRLMHIYGTSFIRTFWDFDYVLNNRGMIEILKDQFNFHVIPCRHIFVDPTAKRLEEARFVIQRTFQDVDHFKKMVERLEYAKLSEEEVNKLKTMRISDTETFGFDEFSEVDTIDGILYDKDRQFIEIVEYFSVCENRYIIVAGGKKVIRDGEIPFKHKNYPFLVAYDIPDPEHFWGISTCEAIYDLQAEVNAIRNNRMDKANFLLNPMFKVKRTALLDKKSLVSRQGGIIRVTDQDDIMPLNLGDMKQADYIEEENSKKDIQTTTGVTDYSLGTSGRGYNETATGVSIITSNADARIISKVKYIEQEVLKPLGHIWLALQKQFMPNNVILTVTGKVAYLNKEIIYKDYELESIASTQLVNKTVRQQQIAQLAQLVTNNPIVNQAEWLKLIFEIYGFPAGKLINSQYAMPQQQLPGSVQPPQGANPNAFQQSNALLLGTAPGFDYVKGEGTQ